MVGRPTAPTWTATVGTTPRIQISVPRELIVTVTKSQSFYQIIHLSVMRYTKRGRDNMMAVGFLFEDDMLDFGLFVNSVVLYRTFIMQGMVPAY